VLVVDASANAKQQQALSDFARTMAGPLIKEVADTRTAPMDVSFGQGKNVGSAHVKAGNLVALNTRCLTPGDDICGNEEVYYPPLTKVQGAYPAFTEEAKFAARGLDSTWDFRGKRSAFLATFSR